MNANEYIEYKQSILTEIDNLTLNLKIKTKQYIDEHAEFREGEKVEISDILNWRNGSEIGYVLNIGIHNNGELYYQFNKAKKDGSRSHQRLFTTEYQKLKIKSLNTNHNANK